jgi:parvulin-like peptidyl-prolyl isomerase
MRRIGSNAFRLWALLALASCSKDSSPVIATVNGNRVRRAEFERFLEVKLGEFKGAGADALLSQMLDEYVRRLLVLDAAARAGITVTDAEIEQAAQKDPQMRSAAATAESRAELRNDLIVNKYYRQVVLRDVRVSPEEVQRYIEENRDRLADRPTFYVREIRTGDRQEAERLHREVTQMRRDFAEVARLHSQGPNAAEGGLARYDEGQLPGTLQKAISQLRPGDISPVVESNFGFHIFKLERRIQPHSEGRRAALDERQKLLIEEFLARRNQQAVEDALNKLVSEADIKINRSALGFTYTGGLGHN